MKKGVPQGSVLGPFLWNLVYDGIWRLDFQTGCRIQAFADDIALTVEDRKAAICVGGNGRGLL